MTPILDPKNWSKKAQKFLTRATLLVRYLTKYRAKEQKLTQEL